MKETKGGCLIKLSQKSLEDIEVVKNSALEYAAAHMKGCKPIAVVFSIVYEKDKKPEQTVRVWYEKDD